MKKLRVAVIGCGAVSKNHGKALKNNDMATLVYAVDIDKEKAEEFSKTYGGEAITNYLDILDKNIDVAHVVTPHNTHSEIALTLLENGIDVFCEKPLAINISDAKKMIKKSKEKGRRLAVCYQNRMNKSTEEAKKIIESGKYGKVISAFALVAWNREGSYYSESPWRGSYEGEGGGVLINQSIHTLDLIDYLLGPVESVKGVDGKFRETEDYEVEDFGMALVKLKSGADCVAFCTNCYKKSKICTLEIHTEKATLTVKQSGLLVEEDEGESYFIEAETVKGEKSEWGVSHGALINSFYKSILEGTPFISEGETGLTSLEIVKAIQMSKGKEIKITNIDEIKGGKNE